MFTSGTVILGAGADGVRGDSIVWVDIYVRGRMPISFIALSRGSELRDNGKTAPISWNVGTIAARFEDVQRIDVRFMGGHGGFFSDTDDWDFNYLKVEIDDPGHPVLYEEPFHHRFEDEGIWSSGILSSSLVNPIVIEVIDESGDRVELERQLDRDNFSDDRIKARQRVGHAVRLAIYSTMPLRRLSRDDDWGGW